VNPRNAIELTAEANEVLRAVEAMSRENETDSTTWTVRVVGPGLSNSFTRSRPWLEAIEKLTERQSQWLGFHLAENLLRRGADATDEEVFAMRRELDDRLLFAARPPPVYEGDRPAGLTDSKIGDAATWLPEHRHRCRTHEGKALVWREMTYDRGRGDGHAAGVRWTHREVHPAIAGEPCPTCQWCNPPAQSTANAGQRVNAQSTSELEREG